MRLVRNLFSQELERETEAESVGMGEPGKQTVIVPLATPQTVALMVESHTRNDGQGDAVEVSEEFTRRFQNAVTTKGETVGAGITMQLKVIAHDGRQDDLLLPTPTVDESMGIYLIGQRVVEQNGASLHKQRVLLQSLEYRYRKGFQLRTGVGSLYGSDGLAEDTLCP